MPRIAMTDFKLNEPDSFTRRAASILLCACLLLALTHATALAQTAATGAVEGRIIDPAGAVVSGAQVELLNVATAQSQKQSSNSSGQYAFSQIAPGIYSLTVTMQGFNKTIVTEVKVEVAKTQNVDLWLDVGHVAERVPVVAGVGVELQKTDASIGNVITSKPLVSLPSLERSAVEFLTLQPGTSPEAGDGDNGSGGGAIAGARSDQSTFSVDGIDVTENSTGGGAGFRTIIPVPVESVEEFRGGIINLGASFARGAGGQVALVGRRGSNEFHGAGYYYHQNDDLNANSWTNNRNGVARAEQRDNRYGFRLGAPLWRNHTFFFTNYEGRNFERAFDVLRVVPTDTLRHGVVRLRDNAGRIVSYDLATSTLCGTTGASRCDPRRLGLSPAVSALWSLLPQGNDASGGDGLNTLGWRSTASTPLESDYFVARIDHTLSTNWSLDGSATYFRRLSTLGGSTSLRQQLDIRGGQAAFTSDTPQRGQTFTLGVTGLVTPNFVSTFRLGWSRDRQSNQPLSPSDVAALLAIPGTVSSAGGVALNIGGGSLDQLVSEPIDVDVQRARAQVNDNEPLQFIYDGSWLRRTHALQFGFNARHILTRHTRNDKSVGSLTSPVADIFRGSNIAIPNTSRPPTCSSPAQTNCLQSTDVAQWDTLFAAVTGMIDTVGVLAVRDAALNAQPFGTPLRAEATNNTYDFYFEDKWQARPSLSVSLGLAYGWQQPPVERLGRQTIMINNETGEPLTYRNYIEPRRQAALAGQIYNPQIAFVPLDSSGRDQVFDTDRNNFSPRLAAAWNPAFDGGYLGKLLGARKTVVRGGFGIVYDRINTSESVIIPSLGVGFSQTITRRAPLCNSTGAGGANCNATGTAPLSVFRVGVDGAIPLPVASAVGVPIVPAQPFGENVSFQIDPRFKVGENYTFDVTVQRELPGKMSLEVGWLARLGRHLPTNVNFNSAPFFQVDPVSGQTFAQAFDAIAKLLRAGTATASVPAQAWFQNNMPGGTTRVLTGNEANFINGNVSGIFQTIDVARLNAGLKPFDNLQAQTSFVRTSIGRSNYNALVATLRKRLSRELTFDLNYTFSKSLDQSSSPENSMSMIASAFFPDFDYGASDFDRTHVFNGYFLYDLPTNRGDHFRTGTRFDKLIEGWSISGIFRAASGAPLVVSQGVAALGGGTMLASLTGAIPLVDPSRLGTRVNTVVAGSNNVGTNGDPLAGGSGVNLFGSPEAAFNSFRRILLSQDGRSGRANPLRGFGNWNLDLSMAKTARVGEKLSARLSCDFFNFFNHNVFANPTLDLTNPRAFGVVTQQTVPTRRESSSRWVQFGLRVEF
jgi:hypothetical protein